MTNDRRTHDDDRAAEQALAAAFDPRTLDDAFYADPYPVYHALRRHDPVHRCPDGSYFLTRHADLARIYRDAKRFSSDKRLQFRPMFRDGPLYEHHTTSLVFNDPPLHTHVRKAIGDAVSMKTVIAMEPSVRALVAGLLDELEDRREFDFIDDFASVIPVEVIGNLLRVPREDRARLRRWAAAILGALEFNLPQDRLELGNQCVIEFVDYLRGLVADRRAHLSDDADDMLSRLLRWESDGFTLSDQQLYHQCIFLLNAGHETTTNLIGNGTHALLTHPDQLARLRGAPEDIANAVEEFLRYESPVQLGNRLATEDVEVGDTRIAAGSTLTLCIGAANRDPEVYPDPDRLDIGREARGHLAFGAGIHTCAGLYIARLEARIAIPAVLERFPRLRLRDEPLRDRRARFRGFRRLPMATH